MEIIGIILEILFKFSIVGFAITTTILNKKMIDDTNELWNVVIKQAKYISDCQNKLKELDERFKEKKGKKKVETKK